MRTKRMYFFAVLIMVLISVIHVFAQDTTAATTKINVPEGFNKLFIVFFVVGMIIHYVVKIWHTFNTFFTAKFWKCLGANFFRWFFNKWHLTVVSTAATAILMLAANWELNISFATLNALGISISIAAGYLGDSIFNGAELIDPTVGAG